ncbi:hypothetical protein ACFOGJ_22860, partial [Marinibaculum pumilum]
PEPAATIPAAAQDDPAEPPPWVVAGDGDPVAADSEPADLGAGDGPPSWLDPGEGEVSLDPMPESFPALVELFQAHRQMRLAVALHHHAHLVRYAAGQVELRLEPEAPRDLAGRMTQHLKAWTGRQWMVTLSAAEGAPTLAAQEAEASASRKAEAAGHPLVKAVLEGFPGAELVEVRSLPLLTGGADLAGGAQEEGGWADSGEPPDEDSTPAAEAAGRSDSEDGPDEEPGQHDEAGAGHAGKNAGDAGRA